ncbi:MAG: Gfo/Idh/MocA family oxidoreductase [Akkermansiaceae bacterium]|nr:Gfo/Idh/MocA family oxidoreductase [Akkermansiaceae bacterium]
MNDPLNRRKFISTTALAGAAIAGAPMLHGQSKLNGSSIKVAVIGCGGRGSGALANFMEACKILGTKAEIVALADAFDDRVSRLAKKHGVAKELQFTGYEAYKKALATDCEYVIMATPPGFRPVHFAAAIDAGKHCFIEKPVAVDPVGSRAVMAAGEIAKKKGLGVVAGTQRRHQKNYQTNKAKIDAGAIGEIRGGVVQWNGRIPWIKKRQEGWSDNEYITRNWLNFTELSGDHIVEQHVHNIDVAIWFLGRLPVSALGFGGRSRRVTGNQFDFFSVDLNFGDDVHIHSQCRQLAGTYGRVGEMFTGTHGSCYGGGKMTGKDVSIAEIKLESEHGMVQEHIDLITSVRAGKPRNEAQQIAESTLVAIMSRMSSYTGQMIRWVDVTENKRSPFYNYKCQVDPLTFETGSIKLPAEEPPIPGKA